MDERPSPPLLIHDLRQLGHRQPIRARLPLIVPRHSRDSLVRNGNVKVLFKFHDEFDRVEFIGTEVTE